ncbi:MAG: hypothetical protein ABIZ34_10505 [Candidatus Limnocylindrales bacterium]
MERKRSGGGMWFVVGVVLAAVLLPAATYAAATLFRLQGDNGIVANVTAAKQLLTVESAPSAYRRDGYYPVNGTTGNCIVLIEPAAGKALIVNQVDIDVKTGPFDASHGVLVTASSNCSGVSILIVNPATIGAYSQSFVPGFPVPAGGALSARAFGAGFTAEIAASGYTVPAAAVP